MREIKGYPTPLGVSERNGIVNFSVEVDPNKSCKLCIYKKGVFAPEITANLCSEDGIGNVRFFAFSKAKVKGCYYNYEIDGVKVLDDYVKGYHEYEGELRGNILEEVYDWEDDRPLRIPHQDVIAYSLHVRGFTMHRSSKVKHKGTFNGLVEKIPYFKELGINQIQCMPIYDFDENTPYTNYWGYGNARCFSIKKKYASSKCPEKEFKDMVKRFHQNGIEIILHFPFADAMPKQLMVECLRYYVMEYHVDGFVLNPYVAPMDSIYSDGMLKNTKILQHNDNFQNCMRQFLRGDKGSVQHAIWRMRDSVSETKGYNYITNHTGFTLSDLVSYNKKRNFANGENNFDGPDENYSWNCGREGNTKNIEIIKLREQQRRNAMALLLLSRGTPTILAGDEFGNSQKGNNNVYCQDNETAWLHWGQLEKEQEFFMYVKELIHLRKNSNALWNECNVSCHGEEAWKFTEEQKEAYVGVLCSSLNDKSYFVAYNMQDISQEMALPPLGKGKGWKNIFTTGYGIICEDDIINSKAIELLPRTIILFVEGNI